MAAVIYGANLQNFQGMVPEVGEVESLSYVTLSAAVFFWFLHLFSHLVCLQVHPHTRSQERSEVVLAHFLPKASVFLHCSLCLYHWWAPTVPVP